MLGHVNTIGGQAAHYLCRGMIDAVPALRTKESSPVIGASSEPAPCRSFRPQESWASLFLPPCHAPVGDPFPEQGRPPRTPRWPPKHGTRQPVALLADESFVVQPPMAGRCRFWTLAPNVRTASTPVQRMLNGRSTDVQRLGSGRVTAKWRFTPALAATSR